VAGLHIGLVVGQSASWTHSTQECMFGSHTFAFAGHCVLRRHCTQNLFVVSQCWNWVGQSVSALQPETQSCVAGLHLTPAAPQLLSELHSTQTLWVVSQ
jgi:hypothetical protein